MSNRISRAYTSCRRPIMGKPVGYRHDGNAFLVNFTGKDGRSRTVVVQGIDPDGDLATKAHATAFREVAGFPETGSLDRDTISSITLGEKRLAEAAEFRDWMSRRGLSWVEAMEELGISKACLGFYRKGDQEIPPAIWGLMYSTEDRLGEV